MRHVSKALLKFNGLVADADRPEAKFISIQNEEDIKGIAPIVSFTIQSDPIGEVGVNGVQATDMLEYVKCLFESLNEAFPCAENVLTITKLKEALFWQKERTNNRIKRGVEGKNEA